MKKIKDRGFLDISPYRRPNRSFIINPATVKHDISLKECFRIINKIKGEIRSMRRKQGQMLNILTGLFQLRGPQVLKKTGKGASGGKGLNTSGLGASAALTQDMSTMLRTDIVMLLFFVLA